MSKASQIRARIPNLRAAFEERLAALVALPTVSMDPARRPDVDACATLAEQYLREAGARAFRIDTGGNPLVVGRIDRDPSFQEAMIDGGRGREVSAALSSPARRQG